MIKNISITISYLIASLFFFSSTTQALASSEIDKAQMAALLEDSDDEESRTWNNFVKDQVNFFIDFQYLLKLKAAREFTRLKKKPLQFARKHRLPISLLSGGTAAVVAYLLLKEKNLTTRYGGSTMSGITTAAALYYLLAKPNKKVTEEYDSKKTVAV